MDKRCENTEGGNRCHFSLPLFHHKHCYGSTEVKQTDNLLLIAPQIVATTKWYEFVPLFSSRCLLFFMSGNQWHLGRCSGRLRDLIMHILEIPTQVGPSSSGSLPDFPCLPRCTPRISGSCLGKQETPGCISGSKKIWTVQKHDNSYTTEILSDL